MLADERGRRSFSFSDTEHALPRPASAESGDEPLAAMGPRRRGVRRGRSLHDCGRARVGARPPCVRHRDAASRRRRRDRRLFAAREHARGAMARRRPGSCSLRIAVSLVVRGRAARTGRGARRSLGGRRSDAARCCAHHRPRTTGARARARVRRCRGARAVAVAATCAGAALAVGARAQKTMVDGVQVARAVAEHYAHHGWTDAGPRAERARCAFEATLEALTTAERDGSRVPTAIALATRSSREATLASRSRSRCGIGSRAHRVTYHSHSVIATRSSSVVIARAM